MIHEVYGINLLKRSGHSCYIRTTYFPTYTGFMIISIIFELYCLRVPPILLNGFNISVVQTLGLKFE